MGWEDPLEKGKATHSSILAWVAKSRLSESLSDFSRGSGDKESACSSRAAGDAGWIPGPPTPVFLSREFHGQWSLVGYGPWGPKELDTTEAT